MTDADFIALARAIDQCWLERRFDDLADFLAHEVVIVAPGGSPRLQGAAAAIESYRAFMNRATIETYETADHAATHAGDAAVVEYAWSMAWRSGDAAHTAQGREVLVWSRAGGAWRVIWRTQIGA